MLSASILPRVETRFATHVDSCAPAHFDLSVLPIYVARVPAAPFTRAYLCRFTLITRIATLPIGSMVVQIVAKSLLILMSNGDIVNRGTAYTRG